MTQPSSIRLHIILEVQQRPNPATQNHIGNMLLNPNNKHMMVEVIEEEALLERLRENNEV